MGLLSLPVLLVLLLVLVAEINANLCLPVPTQEAEGMALNIDPITYIKEVNIKVSETENNSRRECVERRNRNQGWFVSFVFSSYYVK